MVPATVGASVTLEPAAGASVAPVAATGVSVAPVAAAGASVGAVGASVAPVGTAGASVAPVSGVGASVGLAATTGASVEPVEATGEAVGGAMQPQLTLKRINVHEAGLYIPALALASISPHVRSESPPKAVVESASSSGSPSECPVGQSEQLGCRASSP